MTICASTGGDEQSAPYAGPSLIATVPTVAVLSCRQLPEHPDLTSAPINLTPPLGNSSPSLMPVTFRSEDELGDRRRELDRHVALHAVPGIGEANDVGVRETAHQLGSVGIVDD
jgi:hypothetical protein